MNIALWAVQVILAVAFLGAGFLKVTKSRAELEPQMAYVEDLTDQQVTAIGVVEILGGLGIVLPALTGILPILTPIAASGLVVVMVGAALLHIRRGELPMVVVNAVLGVAAAFVAWGRFGSWAL